MHIFLFENNLCNEDFVVEYRHLDFSSVIPCRQTRPGVDLDQVKASHLDVQNVCNNLCSFVRFAEGIQLLLGCPLYS